MAGRPPSSERRSPKELTPERPLAQPPRYKSACEACHASKVKCTGKQPCARCSANRWECVYKLASRIGKPKGSRNKATLRRLQLEAEQAEREQSLKAASSQSSDSSPVHAAVYPITTYSTDLASVGTVTSKPLLPAETGYPVWNWSADTELWAHSTAGDISVHPALAPGIASCTESRAEALIAYEGALTHPFGILGTSAESNHTRASSQPTSGGSLDRKGSGHASLIQESLSYLAPDEASEMPQWSPSLGFEGHSAGTSSPAGTWMTSDSNIGLDQGDPHWNAQPCTCIRDLSGQLGRIDQLRTTISSHISTLRAFMCEANESVQCIHRFLECALCDKELTGLSMIATIFTNINHLFMQHLTHTLDPVAVYVRSGTCPMVVVDADQLAADDLAIRSVIRQWLYVCEQGLRVIHSVIALAASHGEAGAAGSTDRSVLTDGARVTLWGRPDLESFGRMLWRVQQNFGAYA